MRKDTPNLADIYLIEGATNTLDRLKQIEINQMLKSKQLKECTLERLSVAQSELAKHLNDYPNDHELGEILKGLTELVIKLKTK